MVVIQPVKSEDDIETVVTIGAEIWREHYVPIIGSEQVEYMLDKFHSVPALTAQIAEGYHYYLLLNDGVCAGYFAIVPRDNNVLYLSKIYVKKSSRGSGLGKLAFNYIENYARENGFTAIQLNVNKNNSKSIECYKHMGFQQIRTEVIDIGNGFVMDDFVMEKSL